jgi:hypothetical protein
MPEPGKGRRLVRAAFILAFAGSVAWLILGVASGEFDPLGVLSLLVSAAALAGDIGERRWQRTLPQPSGRPGSVADPRS